MIHIIDDFYIQGATRDFTLCRKTNTIDKKTGDPIYKVLGYFGSVSTAIQTVRRTMERELTAEKDMELCEAVTAFKAIAERLEDATKELK